SDRDGARAARGHAAGGGSGQRGRPGLRDLARRRTQSLQGALRRGQGCRACGRSCQGEDVLRQAPRDRRGGRHAAPGARGGPSVPVIASARMYSWSPSAAAAWHRLLSWVAKTAEVDLTLLDQSDPTPLDELWKRDDMGCVFMCGYPWALRRDRPVLLASPVPSPPRYG